jgi:hypothetical protein
MSATKGGEMHHHAETTRSYLIAHNRARADDCRCCSWRRCCRHGRANRSDGVQSAGGKKAIDDDPVVDTSEEIDVLQNSLEPTRTFEQKKKTVQEDKVRAYNQ